MILRRVIEHSRGLGFLKQRYIFLCEKRKGSKLKQIKLVYRYGGRKLKAFTSDGLYFLSKRTEGVIC